MPGRLKQRLLAVDLFIRGVSKLLLALICLTIAFRIPSPATLLLAPLGIACAIWGAIQITRDHPSKPRR